MQLSIRLLVIVLVSLVFGSILVSKQPSVFTASFRAEKRLAGYSFDVKQTESNGSGSIQSPSGLTFGLRSKARSLWEGTFSSRAPMFDALVNPLTASFDGSAVIGLPDETAPGAPRNPLVPAQIVDVFVVNYEFTPDPVHIKAGDTVRWTWNATNHTVTSGTCVDGIYNSGCTTNGAFCSPSDANCASNPVSSTGAVYSHTFSTPGMYPYYCRIHGGSLGMTVTIIVDSQDATPTPTPTTTPTPTATPLQLLLDQAGPAQNQAAALDSLLFTRDQFPVVNGANLLNMGVDRNTRVIVFVMNLQLAPGETSSAVVVNLIDSNNQNYDVAAEDVRTVPNFVFTQVIFRLPDNLPGGTCIITVKAHGQISNPGTLRIR